MSKNIDLKFIIKKNLRNFGIKYKNKLRWDNILPIKSNIYKEIKNLSKKGKKILIATGTGGHLTFSHFDAVLGVALTRYGANVEFLLCDKVLPACAMATSAEMEEKKFSSNGPKSFCESCLHAGKFALDEIDLFINYYSDYISTQEKEEISNFAECVSYEDMKIYESEGIKIGEHAVAGALRYYSVGNIDNEKTREKILKRYFLAALIVKKICSNMFDSKKFDVVVLHHGIYVPQGIILQVAKKYNIKVVTYTVAYKKKAFIFSHDESYERTMMDEPVDLWQNIKWNKKIEKRIIEYLNSRRHGHNDWTYYFKNPNFNVKEKLINLGVNVNKPIVTIVTNIIWDAQLIYPNNIFKNMMEWLFETLKFFEKKDIQIVVRSHPGEINSNRVTKQQVKKEILKKYDKIPKNFYLIGPEDSLSTYGLADYSNAVIIYATKLGMEFSPFGTNIICGGESYVKNKGFTFDSKSKQEYFSHLEKLPFKESLTEDQILLAKKYAYHFFFRRSIEIPSLFHTPELWPNFNLKYDFYNKLINQEDKGLEKVCKSIIKGTPLIFKDEKYFY
jgi:hypothetical protein